MNRMNDTGGTPARLSYLDGDFEIILPGDYVVCAVTGRHIPLGDLRYWSVSRQEAYADAAASHEAYAAALKKGEAF
ncbi:DUF2093 domain-containing protein [Parvularcula marina]|uniref:DUF2093 domain-containing protein n=1 Tax=Parvularcula marina TaxID=2292771 RepID=A0A371RF80_9PROT|nr:DUF2093 domain-containing protein [Parvularcula marina]RFB04118.1 DUF2093 domain-containing protein [Parvularcula marina]